MLCRPPRLMSEQCVYEKAKIFEPMKTLKRERSVHTSHTSALFTIYFRATLDRVYSSLQDDKNVKMYCQIQPLRHLDLT
jgi:hypothetical protein